MALRSADAGRARRRSVRHAGRRNSTSREPDVVSGQHPTMGTRGREPSDAEAIRGALADPSMFAVIFDRHFVTIHRYLVRRIGTPDADDLAGDVFRVAFERRHDFDVGAESARPWLYGIATNLVRSARRSERRKLRALQRCVASVPSQDSGDRYHRADAELDAVGDVGRVAAALTELSPGDRDALLLFAIEGLTYQEVAAALSVPIGTVRSRISRARRQLRELVQANGQQGADWPEMEDDRHG